LAVNLDMLKNIILNKINYQKKQKVEKIDQPSFPEGKCLTFSILRGVKLTLLVSRSKYL